MSDWRTFQLNLIQVVPSRDRSKGNGWDYSQDPEQTRFWMHVATPVTRVPHVTCDHLPPRIPIPAQMFRLTPIQDKRVKARRSKSVAQMQPWKQKFLPDATVDANDRALVAGRGSRRTSDVTKADTLLTVAEISKILRLHPNTIYRLMKHGDIPGFKIGQSWRVSANAVDTWMSSRQDLTAKVSKH